MSRWWEEHDCKASYEQPCWKAHGSVESQLCTNCGQPWPRCLTFDALACLYATGDMLDPGDVDAIEAEAVRRGLVTP